MPCCEAEHCARVSVLEREDTNVVSYRICFICLDSHEHHGRFHKPPSDRGGEK